MAKGKSLIIRNVVGVIVFVAAILIIAAVFLGIVTRHNRYTTVPDMSRMTCREAEAVASGAGIKVNVEDSVYVKEVRKGTVYSQLPKAGSTVKRGRTVDIVINAVCSREVSVPRLVGMSLRQAATELKSRGLSVGKLMYRADIATNNVLQQYFGGSEIFPGERIEAGSEIDLLLGLNYEDSGTVIPDVVGMTWQRAVSTLKDNSLNVEAVHFGRNIRNYSDSLAAVVCKQSPSPSRVQMGSEVSIWLKLPDNAD